LLPIGRPKGGTFMDPILLKAFADYGLTGVLIAVIVLLHWHTVKVQIPGLMTAFREEIAAEREACKAERAEDRAEHQKAFAGIHGRLDRIESKIETVKGKTMNSTDLKNDIDSAVQAIQKLDQNLPGAVRLNALLSKLQTVTERPLVLTLLAAALTQEGF
jgi:hypothetical protein